MMQLSSEAQQTFKRINGLWARFERSCWFNLGARQRALQGELGDMSDFAAKHKSTKLALAISSLLIWSLEYSE